MLHSGILHADIPSTLEPPSGSLESIQHRWYAINFCCQITGIFVLVPVEWQSVYFVVLPGVNSFKGCLSPVEVFVFSEIGRAVYEDNEAFVSRVYEPFLDPVRDELAERVVICQHIYKYNRCHDTDEKGITMQRKVRFTFIVDVELIPCDDL